MKQMVKLMCCLGVLITGLGAQSVGVYGSYIFQEDIDDVTGVGVRARFPVSELLFLSLRGSAYPEVERTWTSGIYRVGIDADYYPLEAGVGIRFPAVNALEIYLEAGLSYILVESNIEVNGFPADVEIEDDEGWYAAWGAIIGEGAFQGFIEGQYRTFTWEVDTGGLPPGSPEIGSEDLDHIALNIGIRYRW